MRDIISDPNDNRQVIHLSSIENFRPVNNYVLIKPYFENIDRKSPGGIYMVPPEFANQPNNVDRIGRVIKLPEKLHFDDTRIEREEMADDRSKPKKKNKFPKKVVTRGVYWNMEGSLEWDTEMEMKLGDLVLFSYLESITCTVIIVKEEKFYLMKYDECYAVKRDNKITVINGYLICEEMYGKKLSVFDVISEGKVDMKKLKVVYVGKPVKKYFAGQHDMEDEIKPGDILNKTQSDLAPKTESEIHARFFGTNKEYVFLQRQHFIAKTWN